MSVDFRYDSSTEAHIQNIPCVENVKNLVLLKKKKKGLMTGKASSILEFHLKYQPKHKKTNKTTKKKSKGATVNILLQKQH